MKKIAIVHDWFNEAGGAEKVVREILYCYPEADIFCLFDFFSDEKRAQYLFGKQTRTSFIQHLPFARKLYRLFFPLFPFAIEQLRFRGYDVIISSSSCVAKGIRKEPGQLHISYCHSPARYAWDMKEDYLLATRSGFGKAVLGFFFNRLRAWDFKSSDRVDYFIANSNFVRGRIRRFFHRDSDVIYPPVNVEMKSSAESRSETYLTVSRLVIYKNVGLLVEAFRKMPELNLEIAGDGPLRKKLMRDAPPNVTFLGYIDEETKHKKISAAKAFLAAAIEDFGITIVEAQSYCTPVIIPMMGGYKETVNEHTGVFFRERTVEDIVATVRKFHAQHKAFSCDAFRANIQRFDTGRFHEEFRKFVDEKISQHTSGA